MQKHYIFKEIDNTEYYVSIFHVFTACTNICTTTHKGSVNVVQANECVVPKAMNEYASA